MRLELEAMGLEPEAMIAIHHRQHPSSHAIKVGKKRGCQWMLEDTLMETSWEGTTTLTVLFEQACKMHTSLICILLGVLFSLLPHLVAFLVLLL